jgi:hypothetical protein|tara:strand:- start:1974 stop:2456 length:483 start_codon:yes stop_codon:yes gene_type:complete
MDDDLLRLYEEGIKTLDDIKVDYAARLSARQYQPDEVLLKTGLLCIKLTENYFAEQTYIADKEEDPVKKKFKRRELDNNYNIGSFVIDDNNRKYYRVLQLTDDDDCKTHCFVGMTDGVVYKPRSQTAANKKVTWDLNECLKLADWRGFYLNPDPKNNMPL